MDGNPASLFDTVITFLSKNAEHIESLIGFPSLIASKLFKILERKQVLVSPTSESVRKILRTFSDAYGQEILSSLNLSNNLLTINEFFDFFLIVSRFLTELDLSSNCLGDNHPLFENIPYFSCLKTLILKDNNMGNGAMRKITLPLKLFNKGPRLLEYLDVSGNKLSDTVIPWLSVFTNLKLFDISGSNISDEGIKQLESSCSLIPCMEEFSFPPVVTAGWAEKVVKNWTVLSQHRKKKLRLASSTFFSRQRFWKVSGLIDLKVKDELKHRVCVKRKRNTSIMLQFKSKSLPPLSRIVKKPRLSETFQEEDIEKDLFSQYVLKPG